MKINEKIKDEALSWIMKEKEGLSQLEKNELATFLSDTNNKRIYEKFQNMFLGCNTFEEKEKLEIKESILEDKKINPFIKTFLPLAACLFLIIFASYFYYDSTKVTYTHTYLTKNTKKVNIHLPDDSYIDMDIKSKLTIAFYKNERHITFPKGKAVFLVAKDKTRPFIIRSKNTRIEVLGTRFEVIALNNIHTINVIEGHVKISHVNNEKLRNLIVLQKGESFTLNEDAQKLKLKNISIAHIAQWKDDLLTFEKVSLDSALKEFARYNDISVAFEDYESSQFEISGVFAIKELDKFIKSLPEIYPLSVKREENYIKLKSLK